MNTDRHLLDRIISFSGVFYIALGIAARWVRLSAAIIGATVYAVFLLFQASRSMELLTTGLIFKIPVVILVVVAVVSALRRPSASTAIPGKIVQPGS